MGYKIMAALILAAFYGIYFVKMYLQHRKGITADKMGKGKKNRDIRLTELIIKSVAIATVLAEILSIIFVKTDGLEGWCFVGVVIALCGVVMLALAIYTIKDGWIMGIPDGDKVSLVTHGIYSISRNPALLGADLLYLGVLIMYFNWGLLIISVLGMIMLHIQMLQEEKYLTKVLGMEYLAYRNRTMRYIGRRRNVHTKRRFGN